MRTERDRLGPWLVALVLAVLVWSGIRPHDRFAWFMEVFPVLLGLPVLLATRHRFPLTPLLTVLLALHACILMLGGKYTYAEVPRGYVAAERLSLARNHYDRLVHFAFGLLWAYPMREVGLRGFGVPRAFASLTALAMVLASSALFEIIEWVIASIVDPEAGQAYLGTQGDEFDAQKDMALAGLGGALTLSVTGLIRQRIERRRRAAP